MTVDLLGCSSSSSTSLVVDRALSLEVFDDESMGRDVWLAQEQSIDTRCRQD